MYQTSIRKKKKNFNVNKNNNYEINYDIEEYAVVKKLLGNCRVSLITNSGDEVIGVIRGTLRKFNKRVLIEKGDMVIVSKRDFQANKVDIVHKESLEICNKLLDSFQISNILKNEYYKVYNNSETIKDTQIKFDSSNSDEDDSYNMKFLDIESSESSDNDDVDIDNI
jgi:translation initiation factor 1A